MATDTKTPAFQEKVRGWLKKVLWWILVLTGLSIGFKLIAGSATIEDLSYKKTVTLELSSLEDQQICGIKPGTRTFKAPQGVEVRFEGATSAFRPLSALTINNAFHDERFAVDGSGCAKVSFAGVTENEKQIHFPNRSIPITFE